MKFQMRVENMVNRTVALDWTESRYGLKSGEDTLVELKNTLLFRKGQKADKAMAKLQSQLDKGLIRVVLVTDQLTQNVVSDADIVPVRRSQKNSKSQAASYEQKLIDQKLEQSEYIQDPTGRFSAVRADDYESAEKLAPTPGMGRAQDEKLVDMTGKSMNQVVQNQQTSEMRDSVVQQAQAKQEAQVKQAKDTVPTSDNEDEAPASKSSTASTAKTKSTTSKKSTKTTAAKSTASKTSGTKSTKASSSTTPKSNAAGDESW